MVKFIIFNLQVIDKKLDDTPVPVIKFSTLLVKMGLKNRG